MPEPTQPDPNELMQLPPMKRSDISNLMTCVDLMVRSQGLMWAQNGLELAGHLVAAAPVVRAGDKDEAG